MVEVEESINYINYIKCYTIGWDNQGKLTTIPILYDPNNDYTLHFVEALKSSQERDSVLLLTEDPFNDKERVDRLYNNEYIICENSVYADLLQEAELAILRIHLKTLETQ